MSGRRARGLQERERQGELAAAGGVNQGGILGLALRAGRRVLAESSRDPPGRLSRLPLLPRASAFGLGPGLGSTGPSGRIHGL